MNKELTEIVFILDRSGSMEGLEQDTIGGFNSMIKKQKQEEGEALVSTILFDDQYEILHDRVPMEQMQKLTQEQYSVRGCTALLDAVGETVLRIKNIHKYAREEDKPGKTLFVITTDGLENASVRYSKDEVKRMIETQQKECGWEFLFIGANIDAAAEAKGLGINADMAIPYRCDKRGTAVLYEAVGDAVGAVRYAAASPGGVNKALKASGWRRKIAGDYEKRRQKR